MIHYLERLVSSVPQELPLSSGHSALRQDANGVDDDGDGDSTDSAEDLPHSFQQIGVHSQQRPNSPRQSQNKTASKGRSVVKRAAKKQAMVSAVVMRSGVRSRDYSPCRFQPLSHDISDFRLFGSLGIPPPKTMQDSQRVLDEVRDLLKFYEEQTTLPALGGSEEVLLSDCLHSPIQSLFAPSESGYSGFSAAGSQFTSPRSSSACSLMNSSMEQTREQSAEGPSGSLNSNSHSHSSSNQ